MSSENHKSRVSRRPPAAIVPARLALSGEQPRKKSNHCPSPRCGSPRFEIGDCVRISIPSETLTVASVSPLSLELVYQDAEGRLQTLFLPAGLLGIVKPRGRRPKEGDKARLPSGGPAMEIVRLAKPTGRDGQCLCVWTDEEGKKRNFWCDANLLEVIE